MVLVYFIINEEKGINNYIYNTHKLLIFAISFLLTLG